MKKRLENCIDFVWWLVATGAVFTLFLWSLQKEEKEQSWIAEPSDELMDYE